MTNHYYFQCEQKRHNVKRAKCCAYCIFGRKNSSKTPLFVFTSTSCFNPQTPDSDWHLLSPYNITLESNIQVTRIKEMITDLVKLLIVKQVLLVSNIGNIQRTVWRIYILMLGCKGFTCLYGIVNVYVFFTFFLVIAVLVR